MSSSISRTLGLTLALVTFASRSAFALPDAATLLADLGYGPDEIAQVQAGQLVTGTIAPASPRELTVGFAFQVAASPAKLSQDLRAGLLGRVDPTVRKAGEIHGNGTLADFAALGLAPNADARAAAYTSGSSDLNLSSQEIASFGALSGVASVEAQVRAALLARVQSYRAQGLAGIAPYVRGSGVRSVADELRIATQAAKPLRTYAPAAYQLLLDYPAGKPPGLEESFRWTQFDAHGTPTIALSQGLFMPDGDAFLAVQRQFYVSTGYNCEQAVAAFLPTSSGTIVLYANRTSTDQVTGFGGGMKRSIGSEVLESQLRKMFQKLRATVKSP